MDELAKQISSHAHYEHHNDAIWVEGDMSVEEYLLSKRDPEGYERNVDGIKRIVVKQDDRDIHYTWKNNQLVEVSDV